MAGSPRTKAPFYANLSVQVLTAIALGVLLGEFAPKTGEAMQPLGEGFIKLIKMVIAPVVFLTVVTGISGVGDMKKVGRIGLKALVYFEVVSTLALLAGLLVVNLVKPGSGLNAVAKTSASIEGFVKTAQGQSFPNFVLTKIIPDSIAGAFVGGEILQVLLLAVLFGAALLAMGEVGHAITRGLETLTKWVFRVISIIMRAAPIGAFGAMAYTIGHFGLASLTQLATLMAAVYLTMLVFVVVGLGVICRAFGFNVFRFVSYLRAELLLVLGTSSSESALPRMIEKMERMGCSKTVTGLVLPTGYSFNLDGTSIYLSMAVLFIAQAFNIDMSIWQQLEILLYLMLLSKGAATVTGGGFVTLAAVLTATNVLPVEGLALLLGVDRFMSEARALVNLVGNGVATVVVAKLEGEFDEKAAVADYREFFGDPQLRHI